MNNTTEFDDTPFDGLVEQREPTRSGPLARTEVAPWEVMKGGVWIDVSSTPPPRPSPTPLAPTITPMLSRQLTTQSLKPFAPPASYAAQLTAAYKLTVAQPAYSAITSPVSSAFTLTAAAPSSAAFTLTVASLKPFAPPTYPAFQAVSNWLPAADTIRNQDDVFKRKSTNNVGNADVFKRNVETGSKKAKTQDVVSGNEEPVFELFRTYLGVTQLIPLVGEARAMDPRVDPRTTMVWV